MIPHENAVVRSHPLSRRLSRRVALDHGAWAGAPLARPPTCSLSLASWDRPSIRAQSGAPTPPRDPIRRVSRQLPPCTILEAAGCTTGSPRPYQYPSLPQRRGTKPLPACTTTHPSSGCTRSNVPDGAFFSLLVGYEWVANFYEKALFVKADVAALEIVAERNNCCSALRAMLLFALVVSQLSLRTPCIMRSFFSGSTKVLQSSQRSFLLEGWTKFAIAQSPHASDPKRYLGQKKPCSAYLQGPRFRSSPPVVGLLPCSIAFLLKPLHRRTCSRCREDRRVPH
jgi:hypothetical protein